jgi:transposase
LEKVEIYIENTSPMAKKDKDSTQSQNEALQKALQEAELKIKALNTLIDVAEEQLKIDIRKKSGAKRS